MTSTTARRIYIDHDAAHEEAIIRRVLVSPARQTSTPAQHTHHSTKHTTTLLGLGRLVRGRLIRRCR
jgi:hypothetical protein